MKSVIISVICIIVIIISWVIFYYYSVEDTYLYYWNELEVLSEIVNIEDWDSSKIKIDIYLKKWEKIRKLWIYLLNQNDVDEIDISIHRLEKYINEKNIPLSLGEIEELKYRFKIVNENECLTLENIF